MIDTKLSLLAHMLSWKNKKTSTILSSVHLGYTRHSLWKRPTSGCWEMLGDSCRTIHLYAIVTGLFSNSSMHINKVTNMIEKRVSNKPETSQFLLCWAPLAVYIAGCSGGSPGSSRVILETRPSIYEIGYNPSLKWDAFFPENICCHSYWDASNEYGSFKHP